MQITIVDVGTPNQKTSSTGRQYQEIELMFKDDQGKPSSRKIMSFTTDLYKTVQSLQRGALVTVQRQKNDKTGYWDWMSITEGGAPQVAQEKTASPTTRVTGSNYETKEERAARQVMIVRQSSLSTAVSALTVGSKAALNASEVINYAKQLEAYVLGKGVDEAVNFDSLENDIPE